jgi:membrane-bound serine protease (ClpP class)
MRRMIAALILTLMAVLALLPATAGAAGQSKVYVIHMDNWQEIDPGLAQFTRRAFQLANADPNAAAVAIVLDTPGGVVDSAFAIKNEILETKLKTITFVQGRALSAGALIATAGEKLYMHPGSSVGAAEPRLAGSTQRADYKTVSAVVGEFKSTAEARGRDPKIAMAMVDVNARLSWQDTDLLVLTAKDAVERQYANGLADDLGAALKQAGLTDYQLVEVEPTFSESAGRLLTTPWVAILLLVVGVIAIGLEFMKPGVTVPGLVGVTALALFFLGNVLVGTAGWLELALALIGMLLLMIEAFIPGFGVFGVGGIIAVGSSIFLAVPSRERALTYLAFTAIAALLALFGFLRAISRRGLGKALTLEKDAKGYVPARAGLAELVGREGKALTTLRPAGTAQFGESKIDVVTEGEFLPAGTLVRVMRVDGTRVVVRSI